MTYSQTFILFGLGINTLASLIMLLPFLKTIRNISDEFIEKIDKSDNYTQKKHEKDKKLGIIGFSLFIVGFIFQIIGVLV